MMLFVINEIGHTLVVFAAYYQWMENVTFVIKK